MRSIACLLLSMSCATTPSIAEAPNAPNAPASAVVVARFADRKITLAEVDAKAGDEVFKVQDQLHELRVDTAERIAIELLVEAQAKKEGLTQEQWVEARLEEGVPSPTERELRLLFDKVRNRLPPDARFEDVKAQLEVALQREAKGKRAHELFDSLKKEAGYQVLLEAPVQARKTVVGSGPARGQRDAKITIVEFADFQCPYCSKASEVIDRVMASYPGQVRMVYRHFPLSFHKDAPKAAEAALCANEQGQFWPYHDLLYAHQESLSVDDLKGQAFTLGLDLKRFERCLDSGAMASAVAADQREGERLGVSGTPSFFVNGLMLSGAQSEDKFRKVIDRELAR